MKGLILVNAFSTMSEGMYLPERLKAEFDLRGVSCDIRRNDFFVCRIDRDKCICRTDGYDFCVFLDKDQYTCRALESSGIPMFNSYQAIADCDDKMLTHLALSDHGIRMPRTLPGPLNYDGSEISDHVLKEAEEFLGFPMVVKECHGSRGKSVSLAKNMDELREILGPIRTKEYLLQEFIGSSIGRDLRVIVIGGRAIGAMERSSDTDFRSNVGSGGKGIKTELTQKTAELCERISDILGLDYCGIDLLYPEDGDPILCEVNSNAFCETFEDVTGINVAGIYADHIIEKVRG